MRKKIISLIAAISLFMALIPGNVAFAKSAPGGIKNNGLGGIYIDINSGSYQTYAPKSNSSYGESGCTWFVSARVNELTGKNVNIHSAENWKNYYSSYGFSIGSTPKAPAIICCTGGSYSHVAILEKIDGNTAYISEGGFRSAGAYHGCCIIRTDNVNSIAATYALPDWGSHTNITYIYLDGASGGGSSTPVHTHTWQTGYENAHPHRQYRKCSSCGATEYTGGTQHVSSCSSCYPVGNVSLTRSFGRTQKYATFYRNNVANANSYTLKLYRNGIQYGTYDMSSSSRTINNLQSGTYYAMLEAKNTNTGQYRAAYCDNFTLVDTYQVNFNANGGTNAPSAQTKIQDENLTLTSSKPTRLHYIFKGWASSKTATEPQYNAGSYYTKNTPITLYAVWEPETYTIKFDMNGGMGTADDATITYGDTMKMPNTVVRESYYLKGWAKNKNATNLDYRIGIDCPLDENMTLYAVWGNSTWGGTVATGFAGGDGTEQNPYQISNAGELAYLAQIVNEQSSAPEYKYYVLTDNINLGFREWKPIGLAYNDYQYFYGSFDGNGYTISDLKISEGNEGSIGLFGKTKDSEIRNLNIYGEISGMTLSDTAYIGTLVGSANNTDIKDCISLYANISNISNTSSKYSYMGAICGYSDGTIEGCEASESYIAAKDGYLYIGHIAGYINGNIADCSVKTSSELFASSSETDNLYLGGICGYLDGNTEKCIVSAGSYAETLKAKQSYIGGIAGYSTGTINLCTAEFSNGSQKNIDGTSYPSSIYAEGSSASRIGGITGYIAKGGKVTNSKYDGQSISSVNTAGTADVGGIAGQVYGNAITKITAQGGQSLSRSSLPTRNGYTATWCTDANLTKEYDFSQPVAADMTLYAKWTEGEQKIEIWDGTSEEPAYDESTKTYTVKNGKELAWVSDVTNGVITNGTNFPTNTSFEGYTIELANDIYLNDVTNITNWDTTATLSEWKPIGRNQDFSFLGDFNGKKYTIKGIYINNNNNNYCGLFGYTGGVLKNINVNRGYIVGKQYVGAIAGNSESIIYNCVNSEVTVKGNSSIGGITGYSKESVSYCTNFATVDGTDNNIGGIAGNVRGSVAYCSNAGGVTSANSNCGGIAGNGYDANIESCSNDGSITGYGYTGGIIGYNRKGNILKCYNNAMVRSTATSANTYSGAGGIVGFGSGTVMKCYNMSSTYGRRAAGIVGHWDYGTVSYCYSIGTSTGTLQSAGIVGYTTDWLNADEDYRSYFKYCYSTETEQYYQNSITTVTSVSKKSLSAMRTLSNLTGFSTNDWAVNSNINLGFPYLKSFEETYKTYNITVIEDPENAALLNKCFVNVDGILFSQSTNRAAAGGAVGYAGLSSTVNSAPANNLLVIANRVSALTSGSSYKAQVGKMIGSNNYSALDFSNSNNTSYIKTISAVNSANSGNIEISDETGTERPENQVKQERIQKQIFGPNTYVSLANLEEHPDAVWVVKSGYLPDLYYNLLRDITISETVNGTIEVDKTQAVDDIEYVTVTAKPAKGYKLNKIYVNGEEIAGTTFEVNGDSDVYATFIEETPEYNVRITAADNASASLVNVDAVNLSSVSLMSVDDNITATDGDEIKVNTAADEEYTVDAVYINGEELAGDSFIITENSVVTMDVTSISTDIKATTGNATDIYGYYATLSGSVKDGDDVSRYIRYWKTDTPDEVYTTEVQEGGGEYSVMVDDLSSDTEYSYQMCENGEVKTFTTMADSIYTGSSDEGDDPTPTDEPEPTEEPVIYEYPTFEIKNQQLGTDSISLDIQNNAEDEATSTLIIVAYDDNDGIISAKTKTVTNIPKDTSKSFDVDVPEAAYYRLFIWKDIKSMLPLADSVTVR